MTYIWINPVTAGMYEPELLKRFLCKHGYTQLDTVNDWMQIVKEKYLNVVSQSGNTVIDMRCPRMKELLDEYHLDKQHKITIPDIAPILIHCGQEAGGRVDLKDEEKIITTPCQSLADMGNALHLHNTRFLPWNLFLQELGDEPKGVLPKESPIPPGFFEELNLRTVSISGEENIRKYFEKFVPGEAQLIELLYCKNGCHNGDGIRGCSLIRKSKDLTVERKCINHEE